MSPAAVTSLLQRLSDAWPVEVRRIALNMDQVRQYNPPPNFVKDGDTRTSGYRERFRTDQCWELDALSPTVISGLIRDELKRLIEPKAWRKALAHENRGRRLLDAVAGNWSMVEKLLAKR